MPVDRVSLAPTNVMADRPVSLLLPEQTAQLALRLLTDYANSGVSDAVSLECAQVCGELRGRLRLEAQP